MVSIRCVDSGILVGGLKSPHGALREQVRHAINIPSPSSIRIETLNDLARPIPPAEKRAIETALLIRRIKPGAHPPASSNPGFVQHACNRAVRNGSLWIALARNQAPRNIRFQARCECEPLCSRFPTTPTARHCGAPAAQRSAHPTRPVQRPLLRCRPLPLATHDQHERAEQVPLRSRCDRAPKSRSIRSRAPPVTKV